MSKHTPGPWEAVPSASRRHHWDIYGSEWNGSEPNRYKTSVAQTSNWMPSDPPEESEANARLIAAAPELLEAVKALVEERTRNVPLLPREQVEEFWELIVRAEEKS